VENIISSLEQNLKDLYRKAVDADNQINELKKQGHGKFQAIFKIDQGFTVSADKFMPYLEEVAEQILAIKNEQTTADLEDVVKKLHLLHVTLGEFKGVTR
jgi:primosomal protein N''